MGGGGGAEVIQAPEVREALGLVLDNVLIPGTPVAGDILTGALTGGVPLSTPLSPFQQAGAGLVLPAAEQASGQQFGFPPFVPASAAVAPAPVASPTSIPLQQTPQTAVAPRSQNAAPAPSSLQVLPTNIQDFFNAAFASLGGGVGGGTAPGGNRPGFAPVPPAPPPFVSGPGITPNTPVAGLEPRFSIPTNEFTGSPIKALDNLFAQTASVATNARQIDPLFNQFKDSALFFAAQNDPKLRNQVINSIQRRILAFRRNRRDPSARAQANLANRLLRSFQPPEGEEPSVD